MEVTHVPQERVLRVGEQIGGVPEKMKKRKKKKEKRKK